MKKNSNQNPKDDSHLKDLTPGIQTDANKRGRYETDNQYLQSEELWFRAMHK